MSFPDDLQIKLIEHSGNALVLGGPGSGKTTTALLKAKYLIRGLQPYQKILFLSFSNSAIIQIKSTLENFRITFSKIEKSNIHILTYHAFCYDIIRNYAFLLGVKEKIKLFPPEILKCELAKNGIKKNSEEHKQYSFKVFKERGLIEFDLFAPVTLNILTKSDHACSLIQSLYPFIILDEFQDTNIQQSQIIYKLASKSTIICLADRQQMIYTYVTGVDEKRIDEAIKILNPQKIDFENRNYRSKNIEVLRFGDNILSKSPQPIPRSIVFKYYRFNNQISTGLKSLIISIQKDLLKRENISTPTIALLTRTNKSTTYVSHQLTATTGQLSFPIFHNIRNDENDLVFCNRVLCRMLGITFLSVNECLSLILGEFSDWCFMNGSKSSIEKGKKLAEWAAKINRNQSVSVNIVRNLTQLLITIKTTVTGQIHLDVKSIINLCKPYSDEFLKRFNSYLSVANHFHPNSKLTLDVNDSYLSNGSYFELLEKYESHANRTRILDDDFSFHNIDVMNLYKVKGREYDAVIIFDGLHQFALISDRDKKKPYDIKKVLRVAVTRARHSVAIYCNQGNASINKEFFNIR